MSVTVAVAGLLGALLGLSLLLDRFMRRLRAALPNEAAPGAEPVGTEPGPALDGRVAEYAVSPQGRRALRDERVVWRLVAALMLTAYGVMVAAAPPRLLEAGGHAFMIVLMAILVGVVLRSVDRRERRYRVDAEGLSVVGTGGTKTIRWGEVLRVECAFIRPREVEAVLSGHDGQALSISTADLSLSDARELLGHIAVHTAAVPERVLLSSPQRLPSLKCDLWWVTPCLCAAMGVGCLSVAGRLARTGQRDLALSQALRDHAVTTVATVGPARDRWAAASYTYRVGDVVYQADIDGPTPAAPGDTVTVAYLPEQPGCSGLVSQLVEPPRSARQVNAFAVGLLLMSLECLAAAWFPLRARVRTTAAADGGG